MVATLSNYAEMFADAAARSNQFASFYRQVAETLQCHFLDAAKIITSSDLDGIHWEASEHHKLGLAVAARTREILGQ